MEKEEKKKSKLKIIIPIVVVIVVIAIVGVVIVRKKSSNVVTEETENNDNEKLTIESVVGTYKNIGLLSNEDVTYTLNENTSFDQTSLLKSLTFKGTFSIIPKGNFNSKQDELQLSGNEQSTIESFVKYKDYFYENSGLKSFKAKKDDYGLTIDINNDTIKGKEYLGAFFDVSDDVPNQGEVCYRIYLKFLEDGTFELHTGYYSLTKSDNAGYRNGYKGTYEVQDDIIKLKYEGQDKEDTLLLIDNKIYFSVLQKQ